MSHLLCTWVCLYSSPPWLPRVHTAVVPISYNINIRLYYNVISRVTEKWGEKRGCLLLIFSTGFLIYIVFCFIQILTFSNTSPLGCTVHHQARLQVYCCGSYTIVWYAYHCSCSLTYLAICPRFRWDLTGTASSIAYTPHYTCIYQAACIRRAFFHAFPESRRGLTLLCVLCIPSPNMA